MAQTVDQIIRQMLGDSAVQMAMLTARIEQLQDQLAEATKPKSRKKATSETPVAANSPIRKR